MKNILVIAFFISISALADQVAIDIGHTPKNFGAVSARGVTEYEFNKRMAFELKALLAENDIKSFIINNGGEEINLEARTDLATKNNATLFISIHHDSAQLKYFDEWDFRGRKLKHSDEFSGYSIFISLSNVNAKENILMAELLGQNLLKSGLKPTLHHSEPIEGENRELIDSVTGIYRYDELAVLRRATMPAILLECGVIVNRNEEQNLNSPTYREKILLAVVNSVLEFNRKANQ